MPNSKTAKKRIRQDAVKHQNNQAKESRMKTELKKLDGLVEAGDKENAEKQLVIVSKAIDKAAKHNIIHKNTAARKKSLAAKKVNSI